MSNGSDVEIVLNGDPRLFKSGTTVAELIRQLELQPERVAIEYNLNILKRARWDETVVKDGDRIEIVQFVGGG